MGTNTCKHVNARMRSARLSSYTHEISFEIIFGESDSFRFFFFFLFGFFLFSLACHRQMSNAKNRHNIIIIISDVVVAVVVISMLICRFDFLLFAFFPHAFAACRFDAIDGILFIISLAVFGGDSSSQISIQTHIELDFQN